MNNSYISVIPQIIESAEEFPVDFDQAWQWIGFSRKDPAKRCLEENFTRNEDFEVFHPSVENPQGGRPAEEIRLTVKCFKKFCMLARTDKGDEVREYFIETEERFLKLRQDLERALPKAEPPPAPMPRLEHAGFELLAECVHGHPLLKDATEAKLFRFLRVTPMLARVAGVKRSKDGRWQYTREVLDLAAEAAHRLPDTRQGELTGNPQTEGEMKRLIGHLAATCVPVGELNGRIRVLSFAEARETIEGLGLFPTPEMSEPRRRSYLGKILVEFAGLPYRDTEGNAVRWEFFGKGNSRRYVLTVED